MTRINPEFCSPLATPSQCTIEPETEPVRTDNHRVIDRVWVNPPPGVEPKILPKIDIDIELEPNLLDFWRKQTPKTEDNKLQLSSANSTQQTLIDRSFGLGESLIREPGWGVAFVLGGILIWREYSKWQLVKKLDKIDAIKIATSIGSVWQKAVLAFDAIDKSEALQGELAVVTRELREDVKHLKTDVNEVKQVSSETGDELSGQLHSLTEIAKRLEQKIDDMNEDVEDISRNYDRGKP